MKKKSIIVTILVCVVLIISAVLISCSKSSDKSDSDKSTGTSFSAGNASEDETATKGEADKATSDVVDKVENITGTVTEGTDQSGDSSNEEPTGESEATPTPSITEAEAELTPTPEDTVVTVTTVATNTPTPTKAVVQKNTPTPTVTVQKNTPTPTPTKVVVQKNTPTPTPTLAPACEHLNSDVVYKKITTPEEGHWETMAAWDEPVYVRGYVCACGIKETDYAVDGKTLNDETIAAFLRNVCHSYGVTDILVDTIHHPESQVWVVDKEESYRLVADYFICYDCGYTESMDYLN